MMHSTKIIVVLFVATVSGNLNDFKIIDAIKQEPPCSSQGGICTIAKDCPTGHLVQETGLCPRQRSMGVECCYGLSVKETRCKQRGGECFPNKNSCADVVKYSEATDCPKESTCCMVTSRK